MEITERKKKQITVTVRHALPSYPGPQTPTVKVSLGMGRWFSSPLEEDLAKANAINFQAISSVFISDSRLYIFSK